MPARGRGPRLPPIRKSLGQHFLTDRRILGRIVDALAPAPDATVIEIGPGRGALTDLLVERLESGLLIAIEYDRALAVMLREKYQGRSNVRIVEADVLETDLGAVAGGAYSLIGNVPYYITTPILFHALKPVRADRAVYLVQREVADRMTAHPGSKQYGALSVNLQALATAELVSRVPAGAFNPPPKVDSAVVRITPKAQPIIAPAEEQVFRETVLAAFGMRRKQMRKVLRELQPMSIDRAEELLKSCGVEPDVRPETLSAEHFAALVRLLRISRDS